MGKYIGCCNSIRSLSKTAVSKEMSGGTKIVKMLLKRKMRHDKYLYRTELVILKRCIEYKDY
jgi:hypothetical protein